MWCYVHVLIPNKLGIRSAFLCRRREVLAGLQFLVSMGVFSRTDIRLVASTSSASLSSTGVVCVEDRDQTGKIYLIVAFP